MLVGSDTGRDGIHGASGLASRTFEEERELRPTVQVGNPFMEKSLIEACLEVAKTDHIIGLQDLGAAGLTSASVESASNGGSGIEIDVALVPRRETEMTPYEVMLSESQERMLVIVKPGHEDAVKAVFDKWDLQSTVIGRSTDDGLARIFDSGELRGEPPISTLTDAPQYRLKGVKAQWLTDLQEYGLAALPLPSESPDEVLRRLLASPNIASKEWVYRQYDHQVQTNTVAPPGADAALLRVKGTTKGLALSTDGNGRLCYLDPFIGGMIAVAEACRNVACTGAEPIALTDCLNFGNPENPETYYQLEQCILGMAEACRALNVPIISGNVSLYNETQGVGIYPTPIIGCLGLLEDVRANVGIDFQQSGDAIVLLGSDAPGDDAGALAGSEYLEVMHGVVAGQPALDIEAEAALQRACRRLVAAGVITSAHDCSEGGLAVAMAESAIAGGLGLECAADSALGRKLTESDSRWDAVLFGEAQSRVVVSLREDQLDSLQKMCAQEGVQWCILGRVSGSRFTIGDRIDLPLSELEEAWRGALQARL